MKSMTRISFSLGQPAGQLDNTTEINLLSGPANYNIAAPIPLYDQHLDAHVLDAFESRPLHAGQIKEPAKRSHRIWMGNLTIQNLFPFQQLISLTKEDLSRLRQLSMLLKCRVHASFPKTQNLPNFRICLLQSPQITAKLVKAEPQLDSLIQIYLNLYSRGDLSLRQKSLTLSRAGGC